MNQVMTPMQVLLMTALAGLTAGGFGLYLAITSNPKVPKDK